MSGYEVEICSVCGHINSPLAYKCSQCNSDELYNDIIYDEV